ncbi:hypothetical protein SLEP1_g48624 [Rubroshorea leprosula]|uniref:BSD domain-containing protein n=1 Tax=Rubroshorea leprosula TaxID=152421 RepID=A0AAV5LU58_9ROSI|nr:hypothetical protein SLEP1_g48624 [Rubroshorea leprosula]
MNFFKSVFADDPEPPISKQESESVERGDLEPDSHPKEPDSDPNPSNSRWNFGSLIKTLATRSESVIETYRRDLQEFGTGLKKEIEVAQGSLETVGHAFDEFGNSVLKGTAQIIAQGKDAILAEDNESDSSSSDTLNTQRSLNSKRYSRFDAQVRAVQGDINTFSEEPDDLEDYSKWRSGFVLEGKEEETEALLEENGEMKNIYKRVVPSSVDHDTFWCRYFYRVFKLQQAEDLRANLVKRAICRKEEEELSWDVDEEEHAEEDERNLVPKSNLKKEEDMGSRYSEKIVKLEAKEDSIGNSSENKLGNEESEQIETGKGKNVFEEPQLASSAVVEEKGDKMMADVNKEDKVSVSESNVNQVEKIAVVDKEDSVLKSDEKVALEGKADNGEPSNSKDSDFCVISTSSQPSMPEDEDLGWDEIEDLSCIDDKKVSAGGSSSPKITDLRKRLNAAEEEEDLSWDIEDDDEPAKA